METITIEKCKLFVLFDVLLRHVEPKMTNGRWLLAFQKQKTNLSEAPFRESGLFHVPMHV